MKIVAGVDGSESSKAALRWAVGEARLRDAELQAVYVWTYPVVEAHGFAPAGYAPFEDLQHGAAAFLDAIVAEVAGDAPVVKAAVEGGPAELLVSRCEPGDLLVVGSRGLGGFSELLLGSVSHQCAHHAPCPVVIVRGSG